SPTLFDENGKLIDSARDFVQSYINQFVGLIERNAK
ncbi:TPA: NAD(P)H-dependent oxidoreductase, partial [Neisseria gonorrhoeae]